MVLVKVFFVIVVATAVAGCSSTDNSLPSLEKRVVDVADRLIEEMSWEDEELLMELTEEGVLNDRFGLQGQLTSVMRADGALPENLGFGDVRGWVDRNVEWTVLPVDTGRSVRGAVTVVLVKAVGYGQLGKEYEKAAVNMRFVVLYGVEGEFPGLHAYRADSAPMVLHGIFDNKYD